MFFDLAIANACNIGPESQDKPVVLSCLAKKHPHRLLSATLGALTISAEQLQVSVGRRREAAWQDMQQLQFAPSTGKMNLRAACFINSMFICMLFETHFELESSLAPASRVLLSQVCLVMFNSKMSIDLFAQRDLCSQVPLSPLQVFWNFFQTGIFACAGLHRQGMCLRARPV